MKRHQLMLFSAQTHYVKPFQTKCERVTKHSVIYKQREQAKNLLADSSNDLKILIEDIREAWITSIPGKDG